MKAINKAAAAIILPGARIGTMGVIAASAVLTRDVPPSMVVGGNPARVSRPRVLKSG